MAGIALATTNQLVEFRDVLGAGYLTTRLDLEPLLAKRDGALRALDKLPDPTGLSSISLLGADEMWPEVEGKIPDNKTLDALAAKDWVREKTTDALRAAAAFFATQRWSDVVKAVEPSLLCEEPPSISGFDLYVGAISRANKQIGGRELQRAKAVASRLLAYWPESFLVNLDLGYLYLYVPGQWKLSMHYSRRALAVRPDSAAANLNLACAFAAKIANLRAITDSDVDEITSALDVLFGVNGQAASKFNAEGDFNVDLLQEHPKFKAWLAKVKPA